MLQNTTIRPGLLVSVRTSIKGNVSYSVTDLGTTTNEEGSEESRWQTDRLVKDKAEQERATKVRSAARSLIQGICVPMEPGGLLCPLDRADKLYAAEAEAARLVQEFNKTAEITHVRFSVITGTIESSDARAIRAINEEMADLMETMSEGLKNLDVGKVREAANKARSVGAMLTPEAQARVQSAIDAARKTARDIKAMGEGAAVEIDLVTIRKVQEARTAFLDLEDDTEMQAAQPGARTVDVDLSDDAPESEIKSAPVQTRMFDF